MDYIRSDKDAQDCVFCPGEDRGRDEERLILHVGRHTMVVMNRYPYNNAHLLVAPVRHVAGLEHLTDGEMLDLFRTVQGSIDVLREVINPEGFNMGVNLGRVAGAGMEDHLHVHIVPRWNGDTNYMTVLDEVRVIPEHLKESYRLLRPRFRGFK
jgi:ATP adenylyltransferase